MQNMAYGPSVNLNPADAATLDVEENTPVVVESSHGQLNLVARVDPAVQAGTVWIPESLADAPVGTLLNGSDVEYVRVSKV
jgi:formylmethanofuran dehydrogenase subunit D